MPESLRPEAIVESDALRSRPTADVIAFATRGRRPRPPAVSFGDRLARAGLAIASHMFTVYDGSADDAENRASLASTAHAGTVVGVLATLAAEAALEAVAINSRSAIEVSRDRWIVGGPADALLFSSVGEPTSGTGGPMTVWNEIASNARLAGVREADLPDMALVLARAETHVGEAPYPVLSVPNAYKPRALLRAAAARHRIDCAALAAQEVLCTPIEQALALGAAIGQVIRHESEPVVLTRLAAEVLVGAARLAPMPYPVN